MYYPLAGKFTQFGPKHVRPGQIKVLGGPSSTKWTLSAAFPQPNSLENTILRDLACARVIHRQGDTQKHMPILRYQCTQTSRSIQSALQVGFDGDEAGKLKTNKIMWSLVLTRQGKFYGAAT